MSVLVIQSARASVLDAYLSERRLVDDVIVLGRAPVKRPHVARLETPPGSLRWDRLPGAVRHILRRQQWSRIVVLHNLGDDNYRDVLAIAARAQPTAPLTIRYADGVEHRYASALTLLARRAIWRCVGSLALALLLMAALPLTLRRARRHAPAGR